MRLNFPSLSPVSWVTAEKVTQQVLWFILFTILAPILGPRPYGVFSVAMVFVGFCEFVLGDGAVEALVTANELDRPYMGTANVANGALALTVTLILVLLAPAIAFAFHDEQLKWLIWFLIPLPVLTLISAAPIALLRRSLQYKKLAVRSIAGLAIGGLFGIALALAGAGVWALAAQILVQRSAETTIVWFGVSQRLHFGWSASHFREMRPVAKNVYAARVMIFASGQLPRLILGYALGERMLGLYTLATRFLDMIAVTAVFPGTAVGRIEMRNLEPRSPEFQQRFARMVQDVALLSFPVLLGAVAVTPDLFQVWLDQRWQAGIVPTQLVLLSGLPLVFSYCLDAAFLAAKQSSFFRTMATLQAVTTIATMACAAPFGLDVACLALAVRPWLLLPYFLSVFRRRCHMPLRQVLAQPLRSLLGAMIMMAVISLPVLHPIWLDEKLTFVLLIMAGIMVYGVFSYSFSRRQLKSALATLFTHRT